MRPLRYSINVTLDGCVDHLHEIIEQSTADLNRLARTQRWCHSVTLLRTMPAIGPITALTILAELGDIDRFGGRAAVSNYAGLVPVQRDSNEKHHRGGITHRGPSHLRGILMEAACSDVVATTRPAH